MLTSGTLDREENCSYFFFGRGALPLVSSGKIYCTTVRYYVREFLNAVLSYTKMNNCMREFLLA